MPRSVLLMKRRFQERRRLRGLMTGVFTICLFVNLFVYSLIHAHSLTSFYLVQVKETDQEHKSTKEHRSYFVYPKKKFSKEESQREGLQGSTREIQTHKCLSTK